VSIQPIKLLWKSEVLEVCRFLGVPDIAISQSRQVDCDCGRFDLAADHIEEIDMILKSRLGIISSGKLTESIEPTLLSKLNEFVSEQMVTGSFKGEIPYSPPFLDDF
jgi:hypothetical protein